MSTSAPTVEETSEASAPVTVRLRGIGKRFPGVIANDDVNIDVRRGTIHAIVGENGAGKSTLMKILYGVQPPDSGTIEINGQQVSLHSPADAIKAGVGMVFQHFMLADNFTVLENVVLGAERLHGIGGDARAEVKRISDAYGLGIEPDRLVEELGVGARQRVEILKVLYRGASIVILDEPTAVLVPQEVDELFGNLRELKKEGISVIFISHKLDEVLSVADEITVIRRGTTVRTVLPTEVTARQLAELMVGSELPSPSTETSTVTDTVLLSVKHLGLPGVEGRPLLDDISFDIHKGEVLGIAGVEGNGQAELVESIMAMRPGATGTIELTDPLRPTFRGAYPLSCGDKVWHVSALETGLYAEAMFRSLWDSSGGVWRGRVREGFVPPDAKRLAQHESRPLAEMIRDINKYSNNVMARQLFLTLGMDASRRPANKERSQRVVGDWLVSKSLDRREFVLENGAGLSRVERLTAGGLATLLQSAFASPLMPEFVSSMPIVGIDGTMRRRQAAAGSAHIKTGLLADARAIAGYVLAASGRRYAVVAFINHPIARRRSAGARCAFELGVRERLEAALY